MDAVALPSAILVKFNPVTPLAGMLYKLVPSPLNEPLKFDAVTSPIRYIEPVLTVFVEINSSTVGPREPDLAIKTLPSVVFNANSPNCKFVLVGFWPGTLLLRSFTICDIYMFSLYVYCGIYHG